MGIILLIVGFIAKIAILWTMGIVVLIIGLILLVLGLAWRDAGGRRHYYRAQRTPALFMPPDPTSPVRGDRRASCTGRAPR